MALSNWLTRNEWNAVYFAGLKALQDGAEGGDMGIQLGHGIRILSSAGYIFKGIEVDEDGDYEKVTQCCDGNETVLAELIGGYGGFDWRSRAKEAIDFVKNNIPDLNFDWLEEAMKEIEAEEADNGRTT